MKWRAMKRKGKKSFNGNKSKSKRRKIINLMNTQMTFTPTQPSRKKREKLKLKLNLKTFSTIVSAHHLKRAAITATGTSMTILKCSCEVAVSKLVNLIFKTAIDIQIKPWSKGLALHLRNNGTIEELQILFSGIINTNLLVNVKAPMAKPLILTITTQILKQHTKCSK